MSFRSILSALRPAARRPKARAAGRRAGVRPRLEPLDDRCLPSANVVLEWNQLALHAVGQARVSPVVASRALAITQTAVYDAVDAIDRSFEPYHAHVHASRGASPRRPSPPGAPQAAGRPSRTTPTSTPRAAPRPRRRRPRRPTTRWRPCSPPRRAPSTRPSPPTWRASLPDLRARAPRWAT